MARFQLTPHAITVCYGCRCRRPGAQTLDPVWNWDCSLRLRDLSGHLSVEVGDEDEMSGNDFLGLVRLKLADLVHKKVCGGWYRLRDKKGEKNAHGRVFVVFAVDQGQGQGKKERSEHERASILYHATAQVVRQVEQEDAAEAAAAGVSAGAAAGAGAAASPACPSLSVFVGTWNVGNAAPQEDLSSWLRPGHDIYNIGVQEAKYDAPGSSCASPAGGSNGGSSSGSGSGSSGIGALGASLLSLNLSLDACGSHFLQVLQSNLGEGYSLVCSRSMMELRNYLFARKSLAHRFDCINTACEATGIAGLVGNKGGVGLSVQVDDTQFVFLTSHLAAHQDMSYRRNKDVAEVVKNLRLNRRNLDVTLCARFLFWGGDLNYRLDYGDQGAAHSPSPEQFREVVSLIGQGKAGLEKLAATDQLRSCRSRGEVFPAEDGWEEAGDLTAILPTFKVARVSGTTYKEQRSPAWCDRILFRLGSLPRECDVAKAAAGDDDAQKEYVATAAAERARFAVRQVGFGSAPDVGSSDHKPVWAAFLVPVPRLALSSDFLRGALSVRFEAVELRQLGGGPAASTGAPSPSSPVSAGSGSSGSSDDNAPANALLKFYASYLLFQQETAHISAAEAAAAGGVHRWAGAQLPVLRSQINNVARLRSSPLVIKVLSYAYESNIERLVCAAQIDLSAGASGRSVRFCAPLSFGGLPAGEVSGTFQLEWAPHGSFTPLSLEQLQAL